MAQAFMLPKAKALQVSGLPEGDFDALVEANILPKPLKVPSGLELWHRESLKDAIDMITGTKNAPKDRFSHRPPHALRRYK